MNENDKDRCVALSQPAAVEGWQEVMRDLIRHIEIHTCPHDETHRGGSIWEICDQCGAEWADDRGGKPKFKWPDCVEKARQLLSAAPTPPSAPVQQSVRDVLSNVGLGAAGTELLRFFETSDDDESTDLQRCQLDRLVTIGWLEKTGRERWSITESGRSVVSALSTSPLQADGGSPFGRDADWALAIADALGMSSGFRIPIVPEARAFRELFASIRSTSPLLNKNDQAEGEKEFALITSHPDCHKAADAFWQYWKENGQTHRRGYYEATWGAINQAIRYVGVKPHEYLSQKIEVQGTTILSETDELIPCRPQPDSNELVVAVKAEVAKLAAAILPDPHDERDISVEWLIRMVANSVVRLRAALAQSPSVGLNTKKEG